MNELATKATEFAKMIVNEAIPANYLTEIVEQHPHWSEFRSIQKSHMKVWQLVTPASISISKTGEISGWLIEKRMFKSTNQVLNDEHVENNARSQVPSYKDATLVAVERKTSDSGISYAIARFSTGSVTINHTDGSLIGHMPNFVGSRQELDKKDPLVEQVLATAWMQLENELSKKVSAEDLAEIQKSLHLSVDKAYFDHSGTVHSFFKIWSFFSNFDLSLDTETSNVASWYCEGLATGANEIRVDEKTALDSSKPFMKMETGVHGPVLSQGSLGEDRYFQVYWWHLENKINIEGDYCTVMVNANTGHVFSVARKWRKIDIGSMLSACHISQDQAQTIANRAMEEEKKFYDCGILVGRNVIQIPPDTLEPVPVTDRLVWRIHFKSKNGMSLVEISVDCESGRIIRTTGW
jgi:hypothetical protein